ncbi:hypothetical protein MW887_000796 [Aspergillus wentii]|nr:hypothetical protein MW887_000796 [Aspergillus wentii]
MLFALGTFAALYTLYICLRAIYYVYFHPLCHVPGPKTWIAFPILQHLSAIRGTLEKDMKYWHARFGTVVRHGRDEVSFITADSWKDIYGHGHSQLPKVMSSASNPADIISANDADHTRFRKALSHAFSAKGLQAQEPLVIGYVDKLIERLKDIAESSLPVDMVKWYNLTTFDLIGDLAFGEPFGGLDSSEYHSWVSTVFAFVKVVPYLKASDSYPLFCKALLLFLPKGFLEGWKNQIHHASTTVQKRLNNPPARDRGDFMDSMLRHQGQKDGLVQHELEANSNILIIAGSETTATLLSGVTYWLLRTPEALAKATKEVRLAMKNEADITFHNVTTQLPYMLSCIDEAFRMYPPVPSGLQRMTLSPVCISGYELPARTKVAVHQASAYMSPANFHSPDRFIPERWSPEAKSDPSSPFFSDNRDVLQPFSVGPRNCIGRNLAYTEMRVILARVLWNFELALQQDSLKWNEQKTYTLWEKLPLMCKLTRRVVN